MRNRRVEADIRTPVGRFVLKTVVCALPAVLLTACAAPNAAFHTREPEAENCQPPASEKCTQSYYQNYKKFDLAFLEYSERGNAFSRPRERAVLRRIRSHAEDEGVVVITFVHGWRHNASEDDRDVNEFRRILENLGEQDTDRNGRRLNGRRLIGVFVGWRGASLELPLLDLTTFWTRKAVAEEVGKGGITHTLLQLDELDRPRKRNVSVVIGHSFGGAIVLSALAEVLAQRIIDESSFGNNGTIRGIGDGVILLNPAVEANQILPVVEAALDRKTGYSPEQNALLITISSDADRATHYAFPAGQTVGLLATWRQTDLDRSYYKNEDTGESVPLREEDLDTTAVGNFAPLLTHRLTLSGCKAGGASVPKITMRRCENVDSGCQSKGWARTPGNVRIKRPENFPLYFIKTDRTFIGGHSDVFNDNVVSFLSAILDSTLRKANDKADTPSIMNVPDELEANFSKFRSAAGVKPSCR